MSHLNIDRDSNGVRITINGQQVDPSEVSQFVSDGQMRLTINGEEFDPSDLSKTKNYVSINKEKRRKSGGCATCLSCLVALIIVGSTLMGLGVAAAAIFNFNIPGMDKLISTLTGIEVPQTQPLVTDADAFEPFVGLAQAQTLAGQDSQLISIDAYYVRSDGTMDLNAEYTPAPNVTYKFVRPVDRPEDAPPVGVAGSTNGQWYTPIEIEAYRPGSRRHVSMINGGSRVSYDYVNEGMVREVDAPTSSFSDEIAPTPKCTAKQLWAIALEHDAPADAVAVIEYDAEGYSFNISGLSVYLEFSHNCKLKD